MATAVASSQAGDANQALDRAGLHHINEDASGIRKQARSIEDQLRSWRDADRLNDCMNACQRAFDSVPIKRITLQLLKFWIT